LAFNPFLGGKRICIGKTFAEVTIRYTVPLLFHYFDFEFTNPSVQGAYKEPYSISGSTEPNFLMKLIIKNKIE